MRKFQDKLPTKTPFSFKRASAGLMALEQRFMFDGAAVVDATQTVTAADLAVKPEATAALQASLAKAEQLAKDRALTFLNQASDQELFALFNGGKNQPDAAWADRLAGLKEALGQAELPFELRVMDRASQFTAVAAFAAKGPDGKPTIFINPYWANLLDDQSIADVMVEEIGHWVDSVLNPESDSEGDEGQRFAQQANGVDVTADDSTQSDAGWVKWGDQTFEVEFASFNFSNAYEMAYDWDVQNNTEDTTERWAAKEQNSHFFKTTSLGVVSISDGSNGVNFSGNDISAIALNVGGNTFYGWISRPIKANGVVRGFYFWTDSSFTSLALAQADGNQDGDSSVADNRGFLLVVDQSWFTQQITNTGVSKTFSATSKDVINGYVANGATLTIANVGSSSDRVDSALNSVLPTNTTPVATPDLMTISEDASGSGNLITGAVSSGTDGNAGSGADTDADAGTTLSISSFTVNGVTTNVIGTSGTSYTIPNVGQITISSNGNYTFTPVTNYNGTVPDINYTVTDGVGGSASSYLRVTVTAVNDAPTIVNDTNIAKEITTSASGFAQSGIIASGNILTNDSDPDGSTTLSVNGLNSFEILNNLDTSATYQTASAKLYFESTSPISSSVNVGANIAYYDGTNKYALYSSSTASASNEVTISAKTDSTYVSGGVTYYRYEIKLSSSNLYYNGNNALSITPNMKFTFAASANSAENSSNLFTAKETSNSPSLVFNISGKGVTTSQLKIGDYVTCSDLSGKFEITNITSSSGTVQTITINTDSDINRNGSYDLNIIGTSTTVLKYGSIKIDSRGNYTYTPNTDITNYQNGDLTRTFNAGAYDTESIQYTVTDGTTTSTETLTITVYGAGLNDAVASNVSATTQEAGFDNSSPPVALNETDTTNNGVNSISNLSGDGVISGTLNVTNDTYAKFNLKKATDASYATAEVVWNVGSNFKSVTGNYGVLTLYGDGTYTYTIDNTSTAIQSLNYGETVYDQFNYLIHTFDNGSWTSNSSDGYTTRNITITINGANDAPTAYDNSNSVYDTPTSSNILSVNGNVITEANASSQKDADPDRVTTLTVTSAISSVGGASSVSVSGATTIQGLYGTLTLNPNGSYSYALDTTLASYTNVIKPLKAGEQLNSNKEIFTYTITDDYLKTSQSTLTIEIYGADQLPTLGVTGGEGEEGSSAVFRVDLIYPTGSNTSGVAVDLSFSNLTTSSGDLGSTFEWSTDPAFATVNGTGLSAGSVQTVTIPSGSSTIYVRRVSLDDNVYEGAESFVLNATFNSAALKYRDGVSGALRANVSSDGSWTFYDDGTASDGNDSDTSVDNDKPTLSIGDATVEEGSKLSFSASLSKASAYAEVITLSAALGTAEAGDFASDKSTWIIEYLDGASQVQTITVASNGSFTLPALVTSFTIKIPTTSDAVYEGLETLTLSANAASTYITDTDTAVGTISDDGSGVDGDDAANTTVDDDRPSLSVTGVTDVSEGSNAIFTVSMNKATEAATLIDLGLSNVSTQNDDYSSTYKWATAPSGPWTTVSGNQISLPAGTTTFYVLVATTNDSPAVYEGAESLKLTATFNSAALLYEDRTSGTVRSGATANANATILDNGAGTIYNEDGTSTTTGVDNDQTATLTVSGGSYNEGSPRAVFTIQATAGQSLTLDVQDVADTGKAPTGDDEGGADDSLNNAPIYYSLDGGLTWTLYTGTAITAGSVPVLVAVDITGERDTVYEGEEQFKLVVTSGAQTASAFASIFDDGTGLVQQPNSPNPDPDAPKDDDRLVRVNNIEVNENSPWAVFRVNGTAGQSVTLALQNDNDASTTNAMLGTDTGTQLQYFNGAAWVDYTGAVTLPASGELLVRVAITDDDPYEGPETFQLVVTPSGGNAAYGTATILDDGTGSVYPDNTTGNPDPDAPKDDDRTVRVNNIEVNENSPWAVFRVNGTAGQSVTLALQNDNDPNTANAKLGTDLGTQLQYFNGTAWVNYTSAVTLPAGGELLVRVAINDDDPYEGPETFQLSATPSGGNAAYGTATILDDGTGSVYPDNTTGNPDPAAGLDDDRPVQAPPLSPPAMPSAPPAPPTTLTPPPPVAPPAVVFSSMLSPLAPTLVPVDPPRPLGDAVTSGSGYQIPVSETAPPGLTLYQGITDQFIQTTNATSRISLPFDAFIHSNKDAVIKLNAKLADDSKLPDWVQFDPSSGTFQVTPPANFKGKLDIKVVARDDDGREATAIFQMFIGEQTQAPQGPQSRDSFSEKLRMASKRPITLVKINDLKVTPAVTAREALPVKVRVG